MGRPSAPPYRHLEVLHAIVQAYIDTGEPVASRTISRHHRVGLSAASIRNIMADLCDDGYLAQPHTSAGRIPTVKAFQSYVRTLTASRLLAAELQRMQSALGAVETMEGRVELSSQWLTEMSRSVGIAAAFPSASQTLSQLELVSLGERRVLMVVVTGDQEVRNRVVSLDEQLSQDDLNGIRNYLNRHFIGWTLNRIQSELRLRLAAESAAYDAMLRKLTLLCDKGLLDVGLRPAVHMEGASNLLGLDLHLTREKTRELFQALEEKKRLLHLLDSFLEEPSGELIVQVGLGGAHPTMRDLSLIGVMVALPGGVQAKVAVLGPVRMNYARVISAVRHVSHAFQSLPA